MVKSRAQSRTRLRLSKRAELVADYEAGTPVKAICEKCGVHRNTIPMIVRRAGVAVWAAGLDADERARASSFYEGRLTLVQVARQISVGNETVRRAVLDEGGQIRPRGPQITVGLLTDVRGFDVDDPRVRGQQIGEAPRVSA
jgi:transposase-like protein